MGNLIIQAVPPEQTGVATAMNTVMRSVGGAVGSQIAATLVVSRLLPSGLPAERGYVLAFATSLGFLVICALASLLVPAPHGAARGAPVVEDLDLEAATMTDPAGR